MDDRCNRSANKPILEGETERAASRPAPFPAWRPCGDSGGARRSRLDAV